MFGFNPLNGRDVNSGYTLPSRSNLQSARMSEIKNVDYTWMALNNIICNHLMPPHSKGLSYTTIVNDRNVATKPIF